MTDPFRLIWDDRFLEYDFGPEHPFRMADRHLAEQLLVADRADRGRPIDPPAKVPVASRTALERFHRSEYLDRVERASERDAPALLDRGDTPSFPGCFDASARIVGGALEGVAAVRAGTMRAFHPAGGLHHAHPGSASGFCIFNDVAVAVADALGGPEPMDRVAYVDIDAHHGDGVMYGFYDDGRLLDIDFHQDGRTLFPGTGDADETGRGDGAGLKVNLPMPPGAGDREFLSLFRRIVPPMLEAHRPRLVILQHGMDGHRGDRLAQLQLERPSYVGALRWLRDWATRSKIPLLVTGGGGYRTESVSRGLADAGQLLAEFSIERGRDGTFTGEGRSAPHARPAPGSEGSLDGTEPGDRGSREWVDRLIERLSDRLGRRF